MPGIFDPIMALMGHPNPTQQIQAALSGPQPNPLAGATPPVASAGQGGGPGASGPSPTPAGPASAPQPMATQTPPDLGQMFVQLMQRQQANEGFNRGLGMLAAGFAQPRDRATMIDAMSGQSGNASGLMGNLMQLQQYQQQQQRLADMQKNLPALADSLKIPLSALTTMFNSNPEGFGAEIAKIQEAQLGLTGDPVQKELAQARREWHELNPGKSDTDMIADKPELAGTLEFTGARTEQGKTLAIAAEDKANATNSFHVIKPTLDAAESNIEWLNDPKNRAAVIKAVNTPEAFTTDTLGNLVAKTGFGGIDQDVLTARSKLNWLKQQLYADRFVGTKNLRSNTEANRLGASATNLDTRTNDADTITTELGRLQNDTYTAQANLAAAAGHVVPKKYAGRADQTFLNKKSPFYNGASEEPADTDGSSSPASSGQLKPLSSDDVAQAKANIAKYGRDVVIAHLKANNYDTSGL